MLPVVSGHTLSESEDWDRPFFSCEESGAPQTLQKYAHTFDDSTLYAYPCTTTNYSSTLMIQPASLHLFESTLTPFDSTSTRSTASCTAQRDRKTVPTSVFFHLIFTQHPSPLLMHKKSSYGSKHFRASLSLHRLPQFSRGIQRACLTVTEDTRTSFFGNHHHVDVSRHITGSGS